jgi:hypothetical protein
MQYACLKPNGESRQCELCNDYFVPTNSRGRPPKHCTRCSRIRRLEYMRALKNINSKLQLEVLNYRKLVVDELEEKWKKKNLKKMYEKPLL